MYQKINYGGWPNCIRISNGTIELIVTTDIGPRVVHFGFTAGQNFLHLSPQDLGKTGGNEWRLYGGHRCWVAPETLDITYEPDNLPVQFSAADLSIRLSQPGTKGIVKELQIAMSPDKNQVTILHRVINNSLQGIELAPWAITALAPGGVAIVPNEPYGEGNDYLLPARSLAVWHYTKMNDARWYWGSKYITATQNPLMPSEQKIGVLNKQEWAAYYLNQELLIKHFDYDETAIYPDYGSNNEVYINGEFLELESLGQLRLVLPGGVAEHTEHWSIATAIVTGDEASLDSIVLPIVKQFKKDLRR